MKCHLPMIVVLYSNMYYGTDDTDWSADETVRR